MAIMRPGIRTFNESIGGQNSETSGYHETITRLWIIAITAFLRQARPASRFEAASAATARFEEPGALLRACYDHDVVNDTRARAEWVAPDRMPA